VVVVGAHANLAKSVNNWTCPRFLPPSPSMPDSMARKPPHSSTGGERLPCGGRSPSSDFVLVHFDMPENLNSAPAVPSITDIECT